MSRHTILVVEGYHDRAFWAGWLAKRGWHDPGAVRDGSRRTVTDPLGKQVKGGGHFAFRRNNAFVRIVPAGGDSQVLPAAMQSLQSAQLDRAATGAIDHVVMSLDADVGPAVTQDRIRDSLSRTIEPVTSTESPWHLCNHTIRVDVAFWQSREAPTDNFANDTLEAVIAHALRSVRPAWWAAVETWLKSRPEPPQRTAKELTWSIMAGWFAEQGCESFLQNALWDDADLASAIVGELDDTGISHIVAAMEA